MYNFTFVLQITYQKKKKKLVLYSTYRYAKGKTFQYGKRKTFWYIYSAQSILFLDFKVITYKSKIQML
jgi:hypothetical protein